MSASKNRRPRATVHCPGATENCLGVLIRRHLPADRRPGAMVRCWCRKTVGGFQGFAAARRRKISWGFCSVVTVGRVFLSVRWTAAGGESCVDRGKRCAALLTPLCGVERRAGGRTAHLTK